MLMKLASAVVSRAARRALAPGAWLVLKEADSWLQCCRKAWLRAKPQGLQEEVGHGAGSRGADGWLRVELQWRGDPSKRVRPSAPQARKILSGSPPGADTAVPEGLHSPRSELKAEVGQCVSCCCLRTTS